MASESFGGFYPAASDASPTESDMDFVRLSLRRQSGDDQSAEHPEKLSFALYAYILGPYRHLNS